MYLTRYQSNVGPRWACDGALLPEGLGLSTLLALSLADMLRFLGELGGGEPAAGALLAPLDDLHEVWAAGVTYLRSREARRAESSAADVYTRVYEAERPELFFKAPGWRVVGPGGRVRIRRDSRWNVPEPELTVVANAHGEIAGYCAGDDLSSRDIEGANPLYLPQAKVYDGGCAIGPGIILAPAQELGDLPIRLRVQRGAGELFGGETRTSMMKRRPAELVAWLFRELSFPHGVLLMTGTGIVPGDDFSLQAGDVVRVEVGRLALENEVA